MVPEEADQFTSLAFGGLRPQPVEGSGELHPHHPHQPPQVVLVCFAYDWARGLVRWLAFLLAGMLLAWWWWLCHARVGDWMLGSTNLLGQAVQLKGPIRGKRFE